MAYRTGRSWGVTIVREGSEYGTTSSGEPDELVAVVVNGDTELAERICALLNADESAAESVREIAAPRRVASAPATVRHRRPS